MSSAVRSARRATALGALAVVGVCLVASGCGQEAASEPIGAQRPTETSIYPIPPATDVDTSVVSTASAPAAFTTGMDGVVRPDPEFTEGAVFEDVTDAQICNEHYTQGVRQPRFNDKVEAFAAYGISIRDRDVYQLDHLVPVSLGGRNDATNLWPQPYDDGAGAIQKDDVERHLRGLVCSRKLSLGEAQAAIVADWWGAHQRFMGQPIDPGTEGPAPWRPSVPVAGEVTNGGPCAEEGAVGFTEPKKVPLTCSFTDMGQLTWQKRY